MACLAAATTPSVVKPKCSATTFIGADMPNVSHAQHDAGCPGIALPAQRRAFLDGYPCRHRRAAARCRDMPASCSSNSSHDGMLTTRVLTPSATSSVARREAQRDLAAAGDQDHVRLAVRRIGQHIGAFRQARGRSEFGAIDDRQRLPRTDQRGRPVLQLQDAAIGFGHLVGVGRPDHDHAGDRPQRHQLLDRLVRRSVLADADRIMRPDVQHRQVHQRRRAGSHRAHSR